MPGAIAGRVRGTGSLRTRLLTTGTSEMANFFDKVLRDGPGSAERKSARKPWWQTTKTSRQGLMLSALWAVLGLSALLTVLLGGAPTAYLAGAVISLAMAGTSFVTAVMLRRRERSGAEADSASQPGPPPSS